MLIICVVFFPQLLFLKSSRLSTLFECFYISPLLDLFCLNFVDFPDLCNILMNFTTTHQVKKMMRSIRQYQVPLQKYMAMMDLQVLIHSVTFVFACRVIGLLAGIIAACFLMVKYGVLPSCMISCTLVYHVSDMF